MGLGLFGGLEELRTVVVGPRLRVEGNTKPSFNPKHNRGVVFGACHSGVQDDRLKAIRRDPHKGPVMPLPYVTHALTRLM